MKNRRIQQSKRKSEIVRWLFSCIAFQAKRFVPFQILNTNAYMHTFTYVKFVFLGSYFEVFAAKMISFFIKNMYLSGIFD